MNGKYRYLWILIDNWPCSIDTYRYFIISMLPITKWNHACIGKLIDEYRSHPEVWDPRDSNCHVRNKKHDMWVKIAENVGCAVSEANCRMTSLLSSYRREKSKKKKSVGTGIYLSTSEYWCHPMTTLTNFTLFLKKVVNDNVCCRRYFHVFYFLARKVKLNCAFTNIDF